MSKILTNSNQLQNTILKVFKEIYDLVSSTLGPGGKTVLLNDELPIITKDGASIIKKIVFDESLENTIAHVIKQSSLKTELTAGDGTTTSIVLAYAIFKEAYKYLNKGINVTLLRDGIEASTLEAVNILKELAEPVTTLEAVQHIATIAGNNDKLIGELIATAIDKAGKDGTVVLEDSKSNKTTLELLEGFRIDAGYISPAFITNPQRALGKYVNPYILVTDEYIDSVNQIMPALELIARANRPLVIFADDVSGQALAAVVLNAYRGELKVSAVKPPGYGNEKRELLEDLAISTGANLITAVRSKTLTEIKLEDFGTAQTIEMYKNETTVVGGNGNSKTISDQIDRLKAEIEQTGDLQGAEAMQKRITRLTSGACVIHVGSATKIELIEKKHRLEDALLAVQCAQHHGYVPGGGYALTYASEKLDSKLNSIHEKQIASQIVKQALLAPIRKLAENVEMSADCVVMEQKTLIRDNQKKCFNAMERNMIFEDYYSAGILDSAKVVVETLLNASSVARSLLTTYSAFINE